MLMQSHSKTPDTPVPTGQCHVICELDMIEIIFGGAVVSHQCEQQWAELGLHDSG